MQKRMIQVGLVGMNQDVINPQVNSKQAFEIKNFRINATSNSNAIELTSEKSTKLVSLVDTNGSTVFTINQQIHKIIGHCSINDSLVLFVAGKNTNPDMILHFKLVYAGHSFDDEVFRLQQNGSFKGDLNFGLSDLVECVPCYENSDVIKIYWIDGRNYPRVINICRDYGWDTLQTTDPFSFYQKIDSGNLNNIKVDKQHTGGLFYAGTVQYAFSFYNKNAQETPIVYTTPLNYISHFDRGEEPNVQVGCSFNLTVSIGRQDHDRFEYVRVYSICTTSMDTTPVVKVIKDIRCDTMIGNIVNDPKYYTFQFVDDNQIGYDFDAYRMLVINEHIKPKAVVTKDQKIFLGNYVTDSDLASDDRLLNKTISWHSDSGRKVLYKENSDNYYNYYNQNNLQSDQIKTFKYGQAYKLGLQFQDEYGNWSSVYPVNTVMNDKHPMFNDKYVMLPYAMTEETVAEMISYASGSTYVKVRPMVSFPTTAERDVLCQGIINPTVFNITDRMDGTCYSQASWFFRPYPFEAKGTQLQFSETQYCTVKNGTTNSYSEFESVFSARVKTEVQNIIEADLSSNNPQIQEIQNAIEGYPSSQYNYDLEEFNINLSFASQPFESGSLYYNYAAEIHAYGIIAIEDDALHQVVTTKYIDIYINCRTASNIISEKIYRHDIYTSSSTSVNFTGNKAYYNIDKTSIPHKYKYDGAVCQFKHYEPLFDSDDIGGEIQGMYFDDDSNANKVRPFVSAYGFSNETDMSIYRNYFYVDHQVCTLNSPDIDFDENLRNVDLSGYKVRIVGLVPFWSNYGSYKIVAESPLFKKDKFVNNEYIRGVKPASGFYNYMWKVKGGYHSTNEWCAGAQQTSAMPVWFDDMTGLVSGGSVQANSWNSGSVEIGYYVYPWNKECLNNYSDGTYVDVQNVDYEDLNSSKILKKVLSNMKFSDVTMYFDYTHSGINSYDINTDRVDIFSYDSGTNAIMSIDDNVIYRGNVDQLLTYTSEYSPASGTNVTNLSGYPITITYYTTNEPVGTGSPYSKNAMIEQLSPSLMYEKYFWNYTANVTSTSPIMMRYSSGKHAVFKISSSDNGHTQNILPIKQGSSYIIKGENDASGDISTGVRLIWEPESGGSGTTLIHQEQINIASRIGYPIQQNENVGGYLWLGEIYRDSNPNSDYNSADYETYKDRTWIPCGKTYDAVDDADKLIKWEEGDVFFQRYDCLKTSSYSQDDYQSINELASFMVETYINLDGRYDKNRGILDNSYVNPTNFNLINPVYRQKNNFFQYNILDQNDFKTTNFSNRFTWSMNKINGQEIDEWTRTNTAAFYDCDGDKGSITSLRRFNNQIYAFQERGISRIKYNENVALNTQNGVPIELGNSQTVNGVDYVSDMVGSQNKWSCVNTPNGVLFVDRNTKGIYRLGGGENALTCLTKGQMQRWFGNVMDNGDVNLASYDATMNDVLFQHQVNQNIAFNIDYNTFTSFYDYNGMIGNLGRHAYNIHENTAEHKWELHFLREGAGYNKFYGEIKPYWVSFVANSNIEGYSPANAIYDNVWYDANVLGNNSNTMNYNEQIDLKDATGSNWAETFNKIEVGNDYQYGIFDATASGSTQTKNFQFIKKFRTWRVPVPRNQRGAGINLHRDRIRGQWMRVKLTNTSPSTDKMVLRNIYVDSFY